MALTKGTVTPSGFQIIDTVELAELDSKGIWARHIKTGAEVFHVVNGDTENTFAFTFKTPPSDSSGVFHIIEHSVLCGSAKYPLKDAFITLAQGSLQTYLNAWTFADKTVYPASSLSEEDYFNLMAVYGDAVYHPRLEEWTFLQEGRRFEFLKDAEGNTDENHLQINGIVYNEMKGVYSALDEYAGQWTEKSVLPDTLYALDSGGDPLCIPALTYTEFLETYKKYYCPANTLIFLYGNIDTLKQLDFLNSNFLNAADGAGAAADAAAGAGEKAPPIPPPKRWNSPRRHTIPSPASVDSGAQGGRRGGGENPVNKLTVFISWLCNEFDFDTSGGGTDCAYKALALDVLSDILLGHDGSPLAKALVSSGLGEDLAGVCGYNDEIKFHVFTAGLRGVGKPFEKNYEKKAARVEKLIFSELKKLVKKGIPRTEIEAALFSEEFSEREIKRPGQGPWALVLLCRALRGWLHGARPWETLLIQKNFERLKNDIQKNPRFFEDLIQTALIDNKHRALVTIKPDKEFTREREELERKMLLEKESGLNTIQKNDIRAKCAALERIQNEPDSEAASGLIPHLSLSGLETRTNTIPRQLLDASGVPVISQKLWTNGIVYIKLAMPVDMLPITDYVYLPLFTACVNALGLPGRHWADVSGELARATGDFSACLHAGSRQGLDSGARATPSGILPLGGRDWFIAGFKTTAEKLPAAFALVTRILREAVFSDTARLQNLVEEARNESFARMSAYGTFFAAARAAATLCHEAAVSELWQGITQLNFLSGLTPKRLKHLARKLTAIRDTLAGAPVLVNITGENEDLALELTEKWMTGRGLWTPRVSAAAAPGGAPFEPFAGIQPPPGAFTPPASVEVFASPPLQTGFSALCVRSADIRTPESSAETALAHYLSTGALWEKLRMKGGAYGARCSVDSSVLCFSTYRDPSPSVSIQALEEIIRNAAPPTQRELEKIIIGVYAKIKEPYSPGKKGSVDFIRYLDGINDTLRQQRFTRILKMTPEAIESAAARIAGLTGAASSSGSKKGICVIAGEKAAAEAAATLGVDVQLLPV